jgi:hypothetical protein
VLFEQNLHHQHHSFRSSVVKHTLSRTLVAGTVLLASIGCQDANPTAAPASALSRATLTAALSSVPIGFGDLATSYVGTPVSAAGNAGLWIGGGRDASFNRGDLMGGGLHDAFTGGIGFGGRGGQRGPFGGGLPCTGTFNASTGRVACADETRNGVTTSRSAQYLNAAGTAQQAFDTLTTNSVNTQSKVIGTITFNRSADSASSGDRGKDCWAAAAALAAVSSATRRPSSRRRRRSTARAIARSPDWRRAARSAR